MGEHALFIWQCISCKMRVQTSCDFHINDRPTCVQCNVVMELAPVLSEEEVVEFMRRISEWRRKRSEMIGGKIGDKTVIILQPENLARMKNGDPQTIGDLILCYEELSTEKLVEILKERGIKYLTRGWQDHPDDYTDPIPLGKVSWEGGK